MVLTYTAGDARRAAPGSVTTWLRLKFQLLLGRKRGIKSRSHVIDSTLRFRSINRWFNFFFDGFVRVGKVFVGDIQGRHDGNAFGNGALGFLGDFPHFVVDQINRSQQRIAQAASFENTGAKIGFAQIGLGEIHPPQGGIAKAQASQFGAGQQHFLANKIADPRLAQVGPGQFTAGQPHGRQPGMAQIGVVEIARPDCGIGQIGGEKACQGRTAGHPIGAFQIRFGQFRAPQTATIKAPSGKVKVRKVGFVEIAIDKLGGTRAGGSDQRFDV